MKGDVLEEGQLLAALTNYYYAVYQYSRTSSHSSPCPMLQPHHAKAHMICIWGGPMLQPPGCMAGSPPRPPHPFTPLQVDRI